MDVIRKKSLKTDFEDRLSLVERKLHFLIQNIDYQIEEAVRHEVNARLQGLKKDFEQKEDLSLIHI